MSAIKQNFHNLSYTTQFSIPCSHSHASPPVNKIINNKYIKTLKEFILNPFLIIKGNKRISSTSKITKIKATRKNCREKGDRAVPIGINPHSKGLIRELSGDFL